MIIAVSGCNSCFRRWNETQRENLDGSSEQL